MDLYNEERPLDFKDCLCTSKAFPSLQTMVSKAQIPHVLLFHGPKGLGKTTLGRIMQAKIKEIMNKKHGTNMDFRYYEINAGTDAGIASARELAEQMSAESSVLGTLVQVFCIDEAQALNKAAQRAFLKPTEDNQNNNVYVIFCSTEPEQFLPELRDRCMAYQFNYPKRHELTEYLVKLANQVRGTNEFTTENISKSGILPSNTEISVRQAILRLQEYLSTGTVGEYISKEEDFVTRFKNVIAELIKANNTLSISSYATRIYNIASDAGLDRFRSGIMLYCFNGLLRNTTERVRKTHLFIIETMKPYLVGPQAADMLHRIHKIVEAISNK